MLYYQTNKIDLYLILSVQDKYSIPNISIDISCSVGSHTAHFSPHLFISARTSGHSHVSLGECCCLSWQIEVSSQSCCAEQLLPSLLLWARPAAAGKHPRSALPPCHLHPWLPPLLFADVLCFPFPKQVGLPKVSISLTAVGFIMKSFIYSCVQTKGKLEWTFLKCVFLIYIKVLYKKAQILF